MNSKKLLIIAPYQFGELSDCYYWAKYATLSGVRTTYIGYKYKSRKIKERAYPGVKTIGVPHLDNRFLLGLSFYLTCILEILFQHHVNIIICRMPHCELLARVFPRRNVILDVRTLSVSPDEKVRKAQNQHLIDIKGLFKTCTVISDGVGKAIGEPYKILPLGAEPLSASEKEFSALRLFYIGTFNGRNLPIFIKGLSRYHNHYGKRCTFDVVGGGSSDEEKSIHDVIESTGVSGVTLHGYLNHDEAVPLFERCNVGVCFVPITAYYQFQPPTKLYEYLLSGMACIATDTIANAAVICDKNGIIIKDDEESVEEGLLELDKRLTSYNSKLIVESSMPHHWDNIVKESLLPLLQ